MVPRPVPAAQTTIPQLLDAFGSEVPRCARLTRELLASFRERPELARAVKDCEHEGDRIARELIHALGRGAGPETPFDVQEGCAWPRRSTTSSTSSSSRRHAGPLRRRGDHGAGHRAGRRARRGRR